MIAPKGEVVNKITSGADCENITALAACNASGKAIDQVVIFIAKTFESSWKGKSSLPTQCTKCMIMFGQIRKCFIDGLKNFAVKLPRDRH